MKNDHSKKQSVHIIKTFTVANGPPGYDLICLVLSVDKNYHAIFRETARDEPNYLYFYGNSEILEEGKVGAPWKKGDRLFMPCLSNHEHGHRRVFDFCIENPHRSKYQGRDNDLKFYECSKKSPT